MIDSLKEFVHQKPTWVSGSSLSREMHPIIILQRLLIFRARALE